MAAALLELLGAFADKCHEKDGWKPVEVSSVVVLWRYRLLESWQAAGMIKKTQNGNLGLGIFMILMVRIEKQGERC